MNNLSQNQLKFFAEIVVILFFVLLIVVFLYFGLRIIKYLKSDRSIEKIQKQLYETRMLLNQQAMNYKYNLNAKEQIIQMQNNDIANIKSQLSQLQNNYREMLAVKDSILKEQNLLLQQCRVISMSQQEDNNETISISETDSMDFTDKCYQAFAKNGIEIYKWQKPCWKCKKEISIISYYLYYYANKLLDSEIPARVLPFEVGLGYVDIIDSYLSKKYPTIKVIYSKTSKQRYMANVCEHCGATQGKNYIVDDPHKIHNDLLSKNGMDKYIFEVICIQDLGLSKDDLSPFFNIQNSHGYTQIIRL